MEDGSGGSLHYCIIKNASNLLKTWLGDEELNLDSRSQSGTWARNQEQCKKDQDREYIKKN